MFHALFIISNILTGILMLGGIKVLRIHWVSGILIFIIPITVTLLTIKGKVIYFLFLRPINISKVPPKIKGMRLTATLLLATVSVSFATGVLMLIGLNIAGIVFKIHMVSFGLIATILPIHVLISLIK